MLIDFSFPLCGAKRPIKKKEQEDIFCKEGYYYAQGRNIKTAGIVEKRYLPFIARIRIIILA
jgi:hypothetical protein